MSGTYDGSETKPWRDVRATTGAGGVLCETYFCQPGKGEYFAPHVHEEYQFYLNHDLPYRYRYRGETLEVPPNAVCVFHPGEAHAGEDVGSRAAPSHFRMLYLNAERVGEAVGSGDGSLFVNPLVSDSALADRFVSAHEALLAENGANRLQTDTALLRLIDALLPHSTPVAAPRPPRREQRTDAVKSAKAFLRDHYARNISLAELVAECHLSGHYLHHAFCEQVGVPPHAFLLNVRVGRAKALLLAGMPLQQVALETGFADQSHFTRCFRRLVGVTPKQYVAPTR